MQAREDLQSQLWELVYDLLPEPQADQLRARITSEPDVARAYAEVKMQSGLLEAASRLKQAPVSLTRPDHPGRPSTTRKLPASPAKSARSSWLLAAAAALLVCVTLYGYFEARRPLSEPQLQQVAQNYVRTVLVGPSNPHPRGGNLYHITTTALDGQPRSLEVQYRLLDNRGKVVVDETVTSDGNGQLQIRLPTPPDPQSQLVLQAGDAPANRVHVPLHVAEQDWSTWFSLDQPAYQSGSELRYRSVTLSSLEFRPLQNTEVEFELAGQDDAVVLAPQHRRTSALGVAHGRFVLPEQLTAGTYRLVQRSRDGRFSPQATSVSVGVPPESAVAGGPREVQFFPEGGSLVAGVENRIYLSVQPPPGRAVEGHVLSGTGNLVARVTTSQRGRGEFRFVPQLGNRYRLELAPETASETPVDNRASDDAGGSFLLPPIDEQARVTFSAEPTVLAAGEPLQVVLRSNEPQLELVIAVICRGMTVGQKFVSLDQAATQGRRVVIPLAADASGLLQVAVYRTDLEQPQLAAQRLVYRRPARYLNVELVDGRPTRTEDGKLRWMLQVRDERGESRPAAVGLAAARPTSVPRDFRIDTYFLLARDLPANDALRDELDYLSTAPEAKLALDLLLGTQPRRSWQPETLDRLAMIAADDQPARTPAGFPLLVDNSARVLSAYEDALSDITQRRLWYLRLWSGVLLVMAAILLLAMVGSAARRAVYHRRVLLPAVAAATACLLVAVIWLSARPPQPTGVALNDQNQAENSGEPASEHSEAPLPEASDMSAANPEDASEAASDESDGLGVEERQERANRDLERKSEPQYGAAPQAGDAAAGGESLAVPQAPNQPAPDQQDMPAKNSRVNPSFLFKDPSAGAPAEADAATPARESAKARRTGSSQQLKMTPPAIGSRAGGALSPGVGDGDGDGAVAAPLAEPVVWNASANTASDGRLAVELRWPAGAERLRLVVNAHRNGRLGSGQFWLLPPETKSPSER